MFTSHLKRTLGLTLCGLLTACQLFSATQSVSGALSLAVAFPQRTNFGIQTIAPETRAIYVMVYGTGLSLNKPMFWGPLTRLNPRMKVTGIPAGPQTVVVAAYDQQKKLISAAREEITIQAGASAALTADLQPEPNNRLRPEELKALSALQPEIPPEPCGFSTSSLQMAVRFPAFQTQKILPQTKQIFVVVYDGSAASLENPAVFGPVTPQNPHLTATRLPVGKQIVLTVALDQKGNILTGSRQQVEIVAGKTTRLEQELKENFQAGLTDPEIALIQTLTLPKLQKQAALQAELFQPDCPSPSPVASPKLSLPEPPVKESPLEPSPSPSQSPEPTATPLPDPTPTPLPSPSESVSNSGGGPGGVLPPDPTPTPVPSPTGASLNLDVTINNGTTGIPPVTAS